VPSNTLTITDNRTGKSYELPIEDGAIRAKALRQIKENEDDFGLMAYDPAFANTASCRSTITFIDGDAGILRYRGYPIEQLAEQATFLEVSYLLLYGELPSQSELEGFSDQIREYLLVPSNIPALAGAFQRDAHPMGMFISLVAALSTHYPAAKKIRDASLRQVQISRLMALVPVLGAFTYRHRKGLPLVMPDPGLSYAANFLHMMFGSPDKRHKPNPVLERAMDILFTLHADHEQNCSTSTMRVVSSAQTDPYSSLAAAAAALYGPLHGGANEAVLNMLNHIGSTDRIPAFIERVKNGDVRLMGFGHRVYKNYDPRARIIKRTAHEVFEVTGRNPLIDVAIQLEKIALEDEYFVARRLYPNVDFYSGIIYQAMGFPTEIFTVLFAIGRTIGWLAHWDELVNDSEQKIARPRQIYCGPGVRDYVAIDKRATVKA
jgi:citrate synthase